MAVSVQDIVDYAKTMLGTPYVWGGDSPGKGLDCSGLVQQTFGKFGIKVPRVSYNQFTVGDKIGFSNLMPGDLVFFDTNKRVDGPDHVGIYLGDGKMIHAPKTGDVVKITDITDGYLNDVFMGGRRVKGTSTDGLTPVESGSSFSGPELSEEELAASYGWAHSFLTKNPELDKLFKQSVKENWNKANFQAHLRNTEWWKTNSDTKRKAMELEATDPATYRAQVDATRLQVKQLAAQMGASIPGKALSRVADDVVKLGMDEGQLRQVLAGYVNFTKVATLKGEAGMAVASMKEYAYSQGVDMTDGSLRTFAEQMVRKLGTEEDYQRFIDEQAISTYPSYEEEIKGGVKMHDIASPYIQQMAQEWEVPYTGISMNDPLIKQALNGANQKGMPAGMTLTDFTTLLRSDDRYRRSSAAQGKAAEIGSKVLKDMGLI